MTVVQSRRLCCDLTLHRLDFSGTARRPGSRRAKTAFGRHTDMPSFARADDGLDICLDTRIDWPEGYPCQVPGGCREHRAAESAARPSFELWTLF